MINKAFSLIELLIVVVIIGVLVLIGVQSYNKQRENSYISWARAEMIEIMKLANMAKSYDGAYHQFIYAMGYRPKGKVFASVGTTASDSVSCCDDIYPRLGSSPCAIRYGGIARQAFYSSYTYYNCKSDALNKATDNIEICKASSGCELQSNELKSLDKMGDFDLCRSPGCNCNKLRIGSQSPFFSKQLTLNDEGVECMKE